MDHKNLLRTLSTITLASALCTPAALFAADKGMLVLNGRLMLDANDLRNEHVVVYHNAVREQEITDGLAHFELKLPLGQHYTLSFEKPGYINKSLEFDTAVPADAHAGEAFTFLFQVKLDAQQAGAIMGYSEPMAIIRFDPSELEFGYDRTHTSPELVKMEQHKRERREVTAFVDPSAPLDAWVETKRTEK